MTAAAIDIQGLGKRYRLGATRAVGRTFADALGETMRRWRRGHDPGAAGAPRDFWALRDLSLTVQPGEVVGVIGHNGAGKSTLLKILSRITDPTEGEARMRGRLASLLEVGTGFHPELTGRENIFLNGSVLGMRRSEIARQFDEIVDFSGVERFLDTPVKRYSSGMRVRLAFAVAAHLEPEVLLIDEVLAVGDAAFQARCLGKMKQVATEQGRTVLFVSHNMASVQQLCSRAVLLDAGRLVADDPPQAVVDQYLSGLADSTGGGDGEIADARRDTGLGERVRLTRCRVLDERGRPSTQLRFGEPFTVEVEAESREAMTHVCVVAGIDTAMRQRITTSMSDESIACPSVAAGQRVRATWRIDGLQLVPGQYGITVGIRANKQGVDLVPHALRFDVVPVLTNPDEAPNGLWGLVHTEPNWQLDTLTQESQAA